MNKNHTMYHFMSRTSFLKYHEGAPILKCQYHRHWCTHPLFMATMQFKGLAKMVKVIATLCVFKLAFPGSYPYKTHAPAPIRSYDFICRVGEVRTTYQQLHGLFGVDDII